MVQGIFMYFGISCFSRRSIHNCRTCDTLSCTCLSILFTYRREPITQKSHLQNIWQHEKKQSLGFEITVMVENGLKCEAWFWMTSDIREAFESRLGCYSRKLTVQSWYLVVSSRAWRDKTFNWQLTCVSNWVAANNRLSGCPLPSWKQQNWMLAICSAENLQVAFFLVVKSLCFV